MCEPSWQWSSGQYSLQGSGCLVRLYIELTHTTENMQHVPELQPKEEDSWGEEAVAVKCVTTKGSGKWYLKIISYLEHLN